MNHPLDFIPTNKRKPIFFALLAGTLILFTVFWFLDAPLRNPPSPKGILSFQLAWTPAQAQNIINAWHEMVFLVSGVEGQPIPNLVSRAYAYAVFGLGLDYLFMPVYASALALGILLAADKHGGWFRTFGVWLGWCAYAAALFDAVENFTLARMLMLNQIWTPYPQIAAVCASI